MKGMKEEGGGRDREEEVRVRGGRKRREGEEGGVGVGGK